MKGHNAGNAFEADPTYGLIVPECDGGAGRFRAFGLALRACALSGCTLNACENIVLGEAQSAP
jgi:hypothetical protein